MEEKFILGFTATEIAAEKNIDRAEEWLRMAAHYVVSFEAMKFKTCHASAHKGFTDGWYILNRAELVSRQKEEYLNEAKPSGDLIQGVPKAV
jgi:hypothetical protein